MINNKRGSMLGILFVVGALFVLLAFGVVIGIGAGVLDMVMDEAVPVFQELGMVDSFNATQATDVAIVPVNNVIQNFTWMTGVLYIFGIIGVFGLAFVYRLTANKWMIGLFFAVMLMLVISSIFISNVYEEFHNGSDELANRLQEHVLLSFMILYSPMILSIIGFLAGLVLFSGATEEFV
tara:strand:- start:1433 stop:1972 length:540 start_codon:yes stop_codon:yes gene_type:complete